MKFATMLGGTLALVALGTAAHAEDAACKTVRLSDPGWTDITATNGVASVVLDAESMVPAAGQGIVGVTVRAADTELHELLSGIEDRTARAVSRAERRSASAPSSSASRPVR